MGKSVWSLLKEKWEEQVWSITRDYLWIKKGCFKMRGEEILTIGAVFSWSLQSISPLFFLYIFSVLFFWFNVYLIKRMCTCGISLDLVNHIFNCISFLDESLVPYSIHTVIIYFFFNMCLLNSISLLMNSVFCCWCHMTSNPHYLQSTITVHTCPVNTSWHVTNQRSNKQITLNSVPQSWKNRL